MNDTKKIINGLDEVWEYMSKNVKDIASRKARMMDKVADACNYLKKQEPIIIKKLVHCKDCKYHTFCFTEDLHPNNPNWFCADGVIKDD